MSVHFFYLEPNQTVSTCFSKNTSAFHNSLNYFFRIYNLLPNIININNISWKITWRIIFFRKKRISSCSQQQPQQKNEFKEVQRRRRPSTSSSETVEKKVLPRSSWTKARWFFFNREHPLVNFESRVLAGQESRWTTPSRTSRRTSRWRASGRWSPSRRPSTWTPGPWRMRPRLTSGFQSPPETCRENACPSERGKRTNSCCSYIAQSWS